MLKWNLVVVVWEWLVLLCSLVVRFCLGWCIGLLMLGF